MDVERVARCRHVIRQSRRHRARGRSRPSPATIRHAVTFQRGTTYPADPARASPRPTSKHWHAIPARTARRPQHEEHATQCRHSRNLYRGHQGNRSTRTSTSSSSTSAQHPAQLSPAIRATAPRAQPDDFPAGHAIDDPEGSKPNTATSDQDAEAPTPARTSTTNPCQPSPAHDQAKQTTPPHDTTAPTSPAMASTGRAPPRMVPDSRQASNTSKAECGGLFWDLFPLLFPFSGFQALAEM